MNTSATIKRTSKKGFYFTEILMLKSIIALLILTFFLLNEMQATNHESNTMKEDKGFKVCETNPESR
jgi:quinol-cytochrome oxidoreductase complex cytochrome b subunit